MSAAFDHFACHALIFHRTLLWIMREHKTQKKELKGIFEMVGSEGFEPPKTYVNRFTVCRV